MIVYAETWFESTRYEKSQWLCEFASPNKSRKASYNFIDSQKNMWAVNKGPGTAEV
jgi:hypothetical protein